MFYAASLACTNVLYAAPWQEELPEMGDLKKLIETGAAELSFRYGPTTWDVVRIPAGEFLMGSPVDEEEREDNELPARHTRISKPFYLGRYQITQAQYEAVMGENPSEIQGQDLAVDQITYVATLEFCRRLSSYVGATVTLPTEAQWEYACRAGTTTKYYSGSTVDDLAGIAWFRGNSDGRVHAVGQKRHNAWGLYDMLGNVYEPCLDYITSFRNLASTDPTGQQFRDHGVARGGAWMEEPSRCRAAYRMQTDDMFGGMGIRIAINLE